MSAPDPSVAHRPEPPGVAKRHLRQNRWNCAYDSNWPPALPEGEQAGEAPLPSRLEPLVDTARAYARAATSKNTNRAYAADWHDYLRWRARQGLDSRPLADPECVGLYLAALASGAEGAGGKARTVATIERRLWCCRSGAATGWPSS